MTRDWRPQQTWVFVVGILEWKHADQFASFPKENRRNTALVRSFTEQGVPDAQILYLQDKIDYAATWDEWVGSRRL